MESDEEKITELTALVDAVRQRVSARYPNAGMTSGSDVETPVATLQVPMTDLMPLVHARDAAQAKIAAIGGVNPRPGGLANGLIQSAKKSAGARAGLVRARSGRLSIAR